MQNIFSIFEFNPNFFIDKNLLRKKYLEKIKQYHSSQDSDKLTDLHNAYKILNDDELRIEYFLKNWGYIQPDGSSDFKLSDEFLMEMMEFNEGIFSRKEQIFQEVQKLLKENLNVIFQLFKLELTEDVKNKIAQKYFERKYLKRLLQNISI